MKRISALLFIAFLVAHAVDLSMYLCPLEDDNCGTSVKSCTLNNRTPVGDCFPLDPCIFLTNDTHYAHFVPNGNGFQLVGFRDSLCTDRSGVVGAADTDDSCTTKITGWTCTYLIRLGVPAVTGNAWSGWEHTSGGCSTVPTMNRGPVLFGECALSPFCDSGDWIIAQVNSGDSSIIDLNHYASQADCENNINPFFQNSTLYDREAVPFGKCSDFDCNMTTVSPGISFAYAQIGPDTPTTSPPFVVPVSPTTETPVSPTTEAPVEPIAPVATPVAPPVGTPVQSPVSTPVTTPIGSQPTTEAPTTGTPVSSTGTTPTTGETPVTAMTPTTGITPSSSPPTSNMPTTAPSDTVPTEIAPTPAPVAPPTHTSHASVLVPSVIIYVLMLLFCVPQ